MKTYGINHPRDMLMRSAHGFTLIELLVSLSIMSALMGAMVLSISLAVRSIDDGSSPTGRISAASDALEEITTELGLALSFEERTAYAVSFTVPDRNEDGLRETIRYAWSGVAGDPVTREYNGGPSAAIAENVHHFDLSYLLKAVDPRAD